MSTFYSYGQNFEDVFLWRCFSDVENGRYVDIGASEPSKYSPSYAFYLRGWSGLLVEPIPELCREICKMRPRDTLLEAAIDEFDSENGEYRNTTLYRTPGVGGTSTIVSTLGEEMQAKNSEVFSLPVKRMTLDEASELAFVEPCEYEFLKIDAEESEPQILKSSKFENWRPKIIVIEVKEKTKRIIRDILLNRGYKHSFHDGINDYYFCQSQNHLCERLEKPISYADGFQRVDQFGSPFENNVHLDARWAKALGTATMRSLHLLDTETLASLYMFGIADHLKESKTKRQNIGWAYWRVFGRAPQTEEIDAHEGKTNRQLYISLVDSEEYRAQWGRSCASF